MPVALRIDYSVGNAQGEQAISTLAAVFERADMELQDFGKHIFPRLVPLFESELGAQYDAEGAGPYAGGWAPLSLAYAAAKRARYGDQPIGYASGRMREALTSGNSPFAARDYSASDFNFGTAGVEYASFQQTGTSRMPARPPFDFTAAFQDKLEQEVQLGIVDAVRAADSDGVLEVHE